MVSLCKIQYVRLTDNGLASELYTRAAGKDPQSLKKTDKGWEIHRKVGKCRDKLPCRQSGEQSMPIKSAYDGSTANYFYFQQTTATY